MSLKYVGVVVAALDNEVLKRAALLCDEVLCKNAIGDARQAVEFGIVRSGLVAEGEKAFADIPEGSEAEAHQQLEISRQQIFGTLAQISQGVASLNAIVDKIVKEALPLGALREPFDEVLGQIGKATVDFGDLYTRLYSGLMRFSGDENLFIPVIYGAQQPAMMVASGSARATVVRVVLQQLPLPSKDTPWEAIREWRQDSEAIEKYRALRAWIARLARDNPSAEDVEEELVSQLSTYERYMAIQHKKMRRTRFEAIILPVAEIAEDALHARLSKVAEKLIGIFKEEVTLLESEIRAPGREVAYIASSRRRFGGYS
jgi:hypothetical protein